MAGSAAYLAGLGTAVPPLEVSQSEALSFLFQRFSLKPATRALYERVFRHPSVQSRRLALTRLDDLPDENIDQTNDRFRRAATDLAAAALKKALAAAGRRADRIDFLAATTCTGYLCPGLASYAAEAAGMRPDARHADLAGMGCGAALPALDAARAFLAVHPGATAAVVCAEVGSAAFFSDDDPALVISNALFGDGAAAAVLTDGEPGHRLSDAVSLHVPAWREEIRFRTDGGRLRNVLTPQVPGHAAEAIDDLVKKILAPRGLAPSDVPHWALHPGGAKVLDAIRDRLGLPEKALASSRDILRQFGNMSSPSCLFVLEDILQRRPPKRGELGILASFGAGFTAHAALLEF